MKKQLALIGILFILIAIGLSGCNSPTDQTPTDGQGNDTEKFIGTWIGYSESECCGTKNKTITFSSSGSVDWGDTFPYTYRVEADTLYIDYGELSNQDDAYSYTFQNNYTTLTLSLQTQNTENNSAITIYLNKQ